MTIAENKYSESGNPFHPLLAQVKLQRPDAIPVLAEVMRLVALNRGTTQDELSVAHGSRGVSYLINYVVTLAELLGWPRTTPQNLTSYLAAHYEWCWVWRRLDDLLDQQMSPDRVALACVDLIRATRNTSRLLPADSPTTWLEIETLVGLMSQTALLERSEGVPRRDIWRRASPFMVIPKGVLEMTPPDLAVYKQLLIVLGLEHDIHDVIDDLRLGIQTEPVRWFAEIEPNETFRADVLRVWLRRAASELSIELQLLREMISDRDCVVIQLLADRTGEIIRELGDLEPRNGGV